MKNQQITVSSISDTTGLTAPNAGANGSLGRLALKSEIDNISGGLGTILQGSYNLTDTITTVSHPYVEINSSYPLVTLTVPNSASLLFVQGITNRTNTSFDVILSSTPATTGYLLNWQIAEVGGYAVKTFGIESISGSISPTIYPNGATTDTKEIILDNDVILGEPVYMNDGQILVIKITQDSIGGHSLNYNSCYKFPGGVATAVTSTGNATDLLSILKVGASYYSTVAKDLY